MPIYEYQCDECGHRLEAMHKISDAPLTDCPECRESSLRKLVSPVGFQLKGTGWYETDFKSPARGKPTDSGKRAADEASAGGSCGSSCGCAATAD